VPLGQRDESLLPYSRISRPEPLQFLPSSSSVVLTRLSGPHSRPTTFFSCSALELNSGPPDLLPGTLTTRPQRWSHHRQKLSECMSVQNYILAGKCLDGFEKWDKCLRPLL
jgi:hypothetical protein